MRKCRANFIRESTIATLLAIALCPAAFAQTTFEFLNAEAAATVLRTQDDYVLATGDLERRAKTHSTRAVSQPEYAAALGQTAKDWTPAERSRVEAELSRLSAFVDQVRWDKPAKLYFIRASAALEDNLPHTRAQAIVLPDSAFAMPRSTFTSMLAHEAFHVLTRYNPLFKEQSYQHIGFEQCSAVRLTKEIEQLKITNPDTPVSQHTISVRYQGQEVHALPFIGFESATIDTSTGFIDKLRVRWLTVERDDKVCTLDAVTVADHSAPPEELQGLFEKIGRNTHYLFHAEEILAENFAAIYMSSLGGKSLDQYPSPKLLQSLRSLWLTPP
jgi:hypothetical protein